MHAEKYPVSLPRYLSCPSPVPGSFLSFPLLSSSFVSDDFLRRFVERYSPCPAWVDKLGTRCSFQKQERTEHVVPVNFGGVSCFVSVFLPLLSLTLSCCLSSSPSLSLSLSFCLSHTARARAVALRPTLRSRTLSSLPAHHTTRRRHKSSAIKARAQLVLAAGVGTARN